MARRKFAEWFATFRRSINGYKYYADLDKAHRNAQAFRDELCMLSSLIGTKDINTGFRNIVKKCPSCLQAIPILLAVREYELYCQDENGKFTYNFRSPNQTIEQYLYFMRETGLFSMIKERLISNLYDYVMGIEVGMDTNGRKNRGGDQMEELVENYLKQTGLPYRKEMTLTEMENEWQIDLSALSSQKRWDFAVKTDEGIYAIETNFYASKGSKLNEISRSYRLIAQEAKKIKGFTFIWITDGGGWESARDNLEETFNVMENLYNIADMEAGILNRVIK